MVAQIYGADAITGLLHVHVAQDIPVAQSPVQKTATLKGKEAPSRSFAFKDDWAAAVFKKWKIAGNVAKIISKDKASLIPIADAVYVQKLFQDAVREANEKARLELKASTSDISTSEQFDAIFPPSLRYISKACEEEILEEIVSRK